MNKIQTSWHILMQSLNLMGQNRKLVLFPLLNMVGIIGILIFFAMPLFLDISVFNFSADFSEWLAFMEESNAGADAGQPFSYESSFGSVNINGKTTSSLMMIPIYLVSMFIATFINVAFYHEILQAFNGSQVSIARGLRFAVTKLRAIFVWSMLAGVVGTIIQQIEEHVGIFGKFVTGLIGVAWSVACVFAIPVIIREEQQSNPVAYLKKSASLIRQTWGEGLAGIVSISLVVWLFIFGLIIFGLIMLVALPSFVFLVVSVLAMIVLAMIVLIYLASVAKTIFLCGLYVYASEGVAPGAFDAQLFDKAWKIKKGKKGKQEK